MLGCIGRDKRLMVGPAFCLSCVPLHPERPDTVTVNYRTECGAESKENPDASLSFNFAWDFGILMPALVVTDYIIA